MGFIPSMLGFGASNTPGAGMNFQATGANITNPVTPDQTAQAYQQAQAALQQQQNFVNAVNAQNGLQNQAAQYQQANANAAELQGGAGNLGNVYNQQQGTLGALQGLAAGTGPNPAQNALNQATGANIAQQGALMASQRGIGANPGMLARQAAQQGAAIQQNAAGQAATMQAQQQLGALGMLGGQEQAMGNTATNQIAAQQAARAQAAGIAGQQVGQQAAAIGGLNAGAQGQQGQLLGSVQGVNQAAVGMQGNMNSTDVKIAEQNAKAQAGLVNGLGGAISGLFAKGGKVPGYSEGTPQPIQSPYSLGVNTTLPQPTIQAPSLPNVAQGPKSRFGQAMQDSMGDEAKSPEYKAGETLGEGLGKGAIGIGKAIGSLFANGGNVSQGASRLPVIGEDLAARGQMVPGKPKVRGDSEKNDIVPARLSPGEVVLPRSIIMGSDPINESARFVAKILARKGRI